MSDELLHLTPQPVLKRGVSGLEQLLQSREKVEVLYLMISPKILMLLVVRAIMVCWMIFGRWMLQHQRVPMLYGKK